MLQQMTLAFRSRGTSQLGFHMLEPRGQLPRRRRPLPRAPLLLLRRPSPRTAARPSLDAGVTHDEDDCRDGRYAGVVFLGTRKSQQISACQRKMSFRDMTPPRRVSGDGP